MWLGLLMWVPNPVNISVCSHHSALPQSRERHQDCSVDVLWDVSLWHDNIKGTESHLGCVLSVALPPLPWALLWQSINNHNQPVGEQGRMTSPSFSPTFPP